MILRLRTSSIEQTTRAHAWGELGARASSRLLNLLSDQIRQFLFPNSMNSSAFAGVIFYKPCIAVDEDQTRAR